MHTHTYLHVHTIFMNILTIIYLCIYIFTYTYTYIWIHIHILTYIDRWIDIYPLASSCGLKSLFLDEYARAVQQR